MLTASPFSTSNRYFKCNLTRIKLHSVSPDLYCCVKDEDLTIDPQQLNDYQRGAFSFVNLMKNGEMATAKKKENARRPNVIRLGILNRISKSIMNGARKTRTLLLFFDLLVKNCFLPQDGQFIPVSRVNVFLIVCFQLQ